MNLHMTLAARYLLGRKLRTFLTTLAVVFGVLLIFAMNSLLPSVLAAFQSNVMVAAGQVDLTITHTTGGAFPATALETVRGAEGVRVAAGSLSRTVNMPRDFFDNDPATPDRVSALTLVGLDPEAAPQIHAYPMAEGRFLRGDDTASVVIATSLAETLGLAPGDRLRLPTTRGVVELTVVGLRQARAVTGNEEALVTLATAQELLNQPGQLNMIEANLIATDPAQREAATAAVMAELGANFQPAALPSGSDLLATLQLAQGAINLFGFLALFMGGFIIFNTFRTVVAERRRDIGMLRAVGASRRTVMGLILAEGLVQGVLGTLIGMILGYLLALGLVAMAAPVLEEFIHMRLGPPIVTPGLVIITVVLGVGMTLLAGLLPARNASRVSPLEALRPEAPMVAQRIARFGAISGVALIGVAVAGLLSGIVSLATAGALLFLVGLALVAPALVAPIARIFSRLMAMAFARDGAGTLAEGNLTRQPGRAAVTASATMIGLAIIVAMSGVITSMNDMTLNRMRQSLGSDYLFIPPSVSVWMTNVGADAGLADQLRSVEGVGAVSTMRFALGASGDTPISLLGIDPAVFPAVSGLDFAAGDPQAAYAELAAGRALIANGTLASTMGLEVGDTLLLTTPAGEQSYRVVGIANDFLNAKLTTAYISQASVQADFQRSEDIFIQVNLAPGADPDLVEPRLRDIVADYPQFTLIAGRDFYAENLQRFSVSFFTMYMLLAVLALPSLIALINTLAIGVIERTREIGMLRAVGATRTQVRRMVLAEALLLAALGSAFGILGGLYLGYALITALSVAGFAATYSFPLAGVLSAVAIGLLFGVLAALLPARQAARMEIVQALRYE